MIQPELKGSTHGHSIVKLEVLRDPTMRNGKMPTKIELALEQSQQGVSYDVLSPTHYPCDLARTFRVIPFSIHSDEWKSFQCHHQKALRYKRWCCSLVPAKSDSLPHAHAQAFKAKHSAPRLLLLNKNALSQESSSKCHNTLLQL
ncbi:hypothetical protein Tco_0735389 [Tanacetum coccineum]